MKVLYLLFSFTMGGTERLVADICNEMVKKNEVHLYIVNDMFSEELLSTLDKSVHVYLQKRKQGTNDKLSTMIRFAKYVKKNDIEIVHCNSFNVPELAILAKIISPKIKIIHTVHGLNQYMTLSKWKVRIRNILCTSLIGISRAVVDDMNKYGAAKKKTELIYNGVDFKKFNDTNENIGQEVRKISCIARVMPQIKGQDLLIEAAKLLVNDYPNVIFEFAGGVAESERENYIELENKIHEYKLEQQVKFIGLVDNIPEYLKTVDICVIPSREEGFGLAMVEAMSMGIPCVASDIGGLAEIVNRENLGTLFRCGDAKELASKLRYVINNFCGIKSKSIKAKDKIMLSYSIESMCNKLQELYEH